MHRPTSRALLSPLGRMDETYIKFKGAWKYLYRAVDKEGKTVGFLLTAKRDKAAAQRFFDKAMKANGAPEKVTMDKSGANKAAMDEINARGETPIIVRQVKYLNNIVEQDHRAIKRVTKPMLNFKSFQAAKSVLAGIELMHMIRKRQLMIEGCNEMSLPTNFMHWQGKSVLFEKLALVPAKITFISGQCDTTMQGAIYQILVEIRHGSNCRLCSLRHNRLALPLELHQVNHRRIP